MFIGYSYRCHAGKHLDLSEFYHMDGGEVRVDRSNLNRLKLGTRLLHHLRSCLPARKADKATTFGRRGTEDTFW
ncbi:hypothetical protein M1O54_05075 [Dehalococcoidia bacterium]|nr:hypothetical protein [Dehalococcoidia bacterium]